MFSFENIYFAYQICKKNKSNTLKAIMFESDLINNLWELHHQLNSKKYEISTSICFLSNTPKLREVFGASFRDRIVHHLLVQRLQLLYEPKFIYDVYNNRAKKGTHKAVKRAYKFMQNIANTHYLQLDIKGFFYNIDKNILFNFLCDDINRSNMLNKDDILWLAKKIIFHNPTEDYIFKGDKRDLKKLPSHKTLFGLPKDIGLPIGNLTSQFFANVYMNRFDHFVKRELKAKCYIRYVDDFVIFGNNKKLLQTYKADIQDYLKNHLKLSLREDFKIRECKSGLDFLGFIIRAKYILTRRRVVKNFKAKKARYLDRYEKLRGDMDIAEIEKFASIRASFLGHIKHSNSFNLSNKIGRLDDEKYLHLMSTKWHKEHNLKR